MRTKKYQLLYFLVFSFIFYFLVKDEFSSIQGTICSYTATCTFRWKGRCSHSYQVFLLFWKNVRECSLYLIEYFKDPKFKYAKDFRVATVPNLDIIHVGERCRPSTLFRYRRDYDLVCLPSFLHSILMTKIGKINYVTL